MSPVLLTIVSGLFLATAIVSAWVSALETALFCLKEHHAASLDDVKSRSADQLRRVARNPLRSLHEALFLGVVLNLTLAVLGLLLLREFGGIFSDRPIVAGAVFFGAVVVFTELVPSLVALTTPKRVFLAVGGPFLRFSPWLGRIAAGLEKVTETLTSRLTPANWRPRPEYTDDEIETLIEMRRDQGVLAKSESEIIQGIIQLGNKTSKDCMTPRVDTLMLSDRLENAAVMEKLREKPSEWHWFVPVFQGAPDLIVGVLDVKRWLYHPGDDFRNFVVPPVFIPETMNALEAFRDYLTTPGSLAVVLDEYGGVEGILTQTDIIEEILADAAPAVDQEDEIEIVSPGRARASGDARLDDLAEMLDIEWEQDDIEGLDTIAGLVFHELGHLPASGDEVVIGRAKITVRRTVRQRITAVEIEVLPESTEEDGESAENT